MKWKWRTWNEWMNAWMNDMNDVRMNDMKWKNEIMSDMKWNECMNDMKECMQWMPCNEISERIDECIKRMNE